MADLEQLSLFLGIKFTFSGSTISMDQIKYIKRILKRFNMEDCKPR